MSTILGNSSCSLEITQGKLALQLGGVDVITLDPITNFVTMAPGFPLQNVELGSTVLTGDFDVASYKITSLANPISGTDALNLQTANSNYYAQSITLDEITLPAADLSLNTHRITNLSDATTDTDAVNRQFADGRFYKQTVTLDSITAPASDLSLNSHSILNVASSVDITSAVNLGYVQDNFLVQTTELQNLTVGNSLNMQTYNIGNVADASTGKQVMTLAQNSSIWYTMLSLDTTYQDLVSGLTLPLVIPFTMAYKPTIPADCIDMYDISDPTKIVFNKAGVYKIQVALMVQYGIRTDSPVNCTAVVKNGTTNIAYGLGSFGHVLYPTNRAQQLLNTVLTQFEHILVVDTVGDYLQIKLSDGLSLVSVIAGTNLQLQCIEYQ